MNPIKVVLCGSKRFVVEMRDAAKMLREAGYIVLEPALNRNRAIDVLPVDLKRYAFLGLTLHHFELIRKADVCLVYNKGGYIGNSTTLEIGFAVSQGLLICALEEDLTEPCVDVLYDFIVGDVEGFKSLLSEKA